MNRYPAWKYVVIVAALLIGVLYAAPNLFPEVPAVQVSTSKAGVKIDTAMLATVESVLKTAGIPFRGDELDAIGIKVRFDDANTQAKARDVLQEKLNPDAKDPDYIVALNLVSSSPQWLASIGALPMYLGLDLRGGVHFLLQVDMQKALQKSADHYSADIRTLMRTEKIQYAGLAREGDSVVVRFRDKAERVRARLAIEKNYPDIVERESDNGTDDLRLYATLKPEALRRFGDNAVQQNIQILRNRVNELGVAEPIVQQEGADRIVVQLPGVQDTARAKDIVGRTGTLEIRMVNDDPGVLEAALNGNVPVGSDLYKDRNGVPSVIRRQAVLTGDRIQDAQPGFDSRNNQPIVSVTLDAAGGRIIRDISRENLKKRMGILLVENNKTELITAPTIQEELGSRFQISGQMTTRETKDIALLMRAGALAAPMVIVEERTVGPSLGAENIAKGFDSVK
ncbi:MAG: preprotein translocase subunit SecD, partial [Casimicrobiaceae bacterium]